MKKTSLSALVAAGLLAGGLATSASAADLGGDCCADLEERVAELEATTARKGNRKVSLTVSGWVAEQVLFWDDGIESNVYQIGLGSTIGSNVKFSGQAQITPGWTAGYLLHIEGNTADSLFVNQNADDAGNLQFSGLGTGSGAIFADLALMQSYWFIKSDRLGKVSIGQQSHATDNTAILVDGSGSLLQANWVAYESNSFAIRTSGGGSAGIGWGQAASCRGNGGAWGDCNGVPANTVRYDSPTFAGFSISTDWGEDDFWGIAARYAGEHSGFKLAVAAGYSETTEHLAIPRPNTLEYFQLGVYTQHVPTGLFFLYNFGYLDEDVDSEGGRAAPPETDTHYFKAGLRRQFNPLGHTVLYGEYLKNNDGSDLIAAGFATESEMDVWGLGVVQEIDAAAMSVWLEFRHHSYDDNSGADYEDFDYVAVGGLINF